MPNIILLVLDTVGAKHLSLYGYHRPTTPHLEKIAQECTVYSRCFAPSCWTVPSHASLFTGLYPSQHGAYETNYLLRDNLPHLVSVLKASGYRTVGISSNGVVSPATGICQDFVEFHDLGAPDLERLLPRPKTRKEHPAPDNLASLLKKAVNMGDALSTICKYLAETGRVGEVTQNCLELGRGLAEKVFWPRPLDDATPYTRKTVHLMRDILRRQAGAEAPLFLFVNFLQAHHDYRPPMWRRRFSRWYHRAQVPPLRFYRRLPSEALDALVAQYRDLYDDEILYLDAVLGQFWEMLRNSPLMKDTLVIITSDHGEHLGEKRHYTHVLSLYNELLWVPLIIRFPAGLGIPPGKEARLVSLNDLYATILDAVGSPLPRPDTSVSLLSARRRALAVAQCVFPEMWRVPLADKLTICRSLGEDFSPPIFAVMTEEGRKIIANRDGSLEVYDLQDNMAEEVDLASTLSAAALEGYHHLLAGLQAETGFAEATAGLLARAEMAAAPN